MNRANRSPAFVLFLAAACTGLDAWAQESIRDFRSHAIVGEDGSIEVTETISVRAEGDQIRRGILRELPKVQADQNKRPLALPLTVHSVTLDGDPVVWRVEETPRTHLIRIGQPTVFLEPGDYTYRIVYSAPGQVRFGEGTDRLFWNVTGDWPFQVHRASLVVELPEGATLTEIVPYVLGSRDERRVDTRGVGGNVARVESNANLPHARGLAVALSWPAGRINRGASDAPAAPTKSPARAPAVSDPAASEPESLVIVGSTGAAALLAALGFYGFAWRRRREAIGSIPVRYEPPNNLSAAGCRYVTHGFDRRALTAAFVSLAVKGVMKLRMNRQEHRAFRLTPQSHEGVSFEWRGAGAGLSAEEVFLRNTLFNQDRTVVSLADDRAVLRVAESGLKSTLEKEHETPGSLGDASPFFAIGLACAFFALVLGVGVVTAGEEFLSRGLIVLIITATGLAILGCYAAPRVGHNPKHTKLLRDIEGFKHFLSFVEQDRLDRLNPPERTPKLFSEYLPYAIALDVENRWGEAFDDIVDLASMDPSENDLDWYDSDGSWSVSSLSAMASSLDLAVSKSTEDTGWDGDSGSGGGGGGGSSSTGGGGGW